VALSFGQGQPAGHDGAGNLAAALQGFIALPLLVGFDLDDPDPVGAGRIVSFDAAGGTHVEVEGFQSVGSGSLFAKSSMKKLYSRVADADSALRVAIEALYDAADDDSATGGPDLVRGIYPTAVTIGVEGARMSMRTRSPSWLVR
jgi:proteasome beta subunit